MAVFRLGLVGAGRMGRTHLQALSDSDGVRVVAAAEPAPLARDVLAQTGLTVHAEVDAMLDAGGLDGVLIATPSDRHVDMVRRVAEAGLPILCEKPCGTTAAEAREAARIATAAGVPLQIAYWRRFVPALRELRRRIVAGELGNLYFVACYQWDANVPAASFREHSGGILVDMGVHEFDQLRWLTGQEFASVHVSIPTAASEPLVAGDSESAQILCTMSGGTSGLVSLGRRFPQGDVCWTQVFGTKGSEECRFLWPPDADATFHHALRLQAESFALAASGTPSEAAGAEDAVAVLTAAERASGMIRELASIE
jgi:myo-inositol 2-dehydrogenase / D-chiro-inositol 1-dehydrogenase